MKSKQNKQSESGSSVQTLREHLSGMTAMEKFEYIVTYYWGRILLAVGLVIVLVWGVRWVGNLQNNTIFYVALMDSAYSQEEADALCEGFVDTLEGVGTHDIMRLDTSLIYLPEGQKGTQLYNSYLSKEIIMESSGLDVYLTPQEFYEENKDDEEMFLSLEEVLGEEYETYAEDILDGTALVLEDCLILQQDGANYEPIYLTVPSGAAHVDLIPAFIRYLTQ
ncbi:MAG: hypothetical protein LUD78_01525 [Clostridiales bacterium]|nr:hypothetical protein [Clostridiales bacterium]